VEQGGADEILRRPTEPYTKALIAAIPHFEPQKAIH
jgi:ABC-type oligopeptide transport system ATPase subunit